MKNKLTQREVRERIHFDNCSKGYDDNYHYTNPFTKYKIKKKISDLASVINFSFSGRPLKILEVGCGTGEYTQEIAKMYSKSEIVGLDISSKILDVAKSKCKKFSNVKFVSASAYHTRFSKNRFDLIVGFYALHHLDIRRFVKEAYRLLKPGGIMFFCEPNILNPIVYLIKSNKWLKKRVGDSRDEWAINPLTVLRSFPGFELIRMSTSEFVLPIDALPLSTMVAVDSVLNFLRYIFPFKYLGGSIQLVFRKTL